jgi:hypothetical protein
MRTSTGFPPKRYLAMQRFRRSVYEIATRSAGLSVIALNLGFSYQAHLTREFRRLDAAVAWAALVPPDCHTAYAFSKRALQANTMAAIDNAARLDRDWLSRGMSDLGSIHAHARRYRELKGRDMTWPMPA